MADDTADNVVEANVSLAQKMLSATTGSILTSLLGTYKFVIVLFQYSLGTPTSMAVWSLYRW